MERIHPSDPPSELTKDEKLYRLCLDDILGIHYDKIAGLGSRTPNKTIKITKADSSLGSIVVAGLENDVSTSVFRAVAHQANINWKHLQTHTNAVIDNMLLQQMWHQRPSGMDLVNFTTTILGIGYVIFYLDGSVYVNINQLICDIIVFLYMDATKTPPVFYSVLQINARQN